MDFARARRMMVESQVRIADVTEPRLIAALADVPREAFAPAERKAVAYLDLDLPLGQGRHLVEPMVFAKLVQAAAIEPGELVLDIGCATGWTTAVLARLAGAVVALEEDATLAARAQTLLAEQDVANVTVERGALSAGWPAQGPYDVIMVEGAVDHVPPALLAQLSSNGRLLTVVGRGRSGRATLYRAVAGDVAARTLFDAALPPLPGFAAEPGFVF